MPVEVLHEFEKIFGENLVMEGSGLTETSSSTTMMRLDRPRKVGSCGLGQWVVRIRVVDENVHDAPIGQTGEVVVQGHCTMKGYFNQPEATAEAYKGG